MPVIPGTQVFLCYSRFSNGRGPKACIHLYANHCVPFEITPISPAALLYLAKNKEDSCFSSRRRLRICLNLLENKKNQALCMTQPSFRWKTGSTLSTFRLLLSKAKSHCSPPLLTIIFIAAKSPFKSFTRSKL